MAFGEIYKTIIAPIKQPIDKVALSQSGQNIAICQLSKKVKDPILTLYSIHEDKPIAFIERQNNDNCSVFDMVFISENELLYLFNNGERNAEVKYFHIETKEQRVIIILPSLSGYPFLSFNNLNQLLLWKFPLEIIDINSSKIYQFNNSSNMPDISNFTTLFRLFKENKVFIGGHQKSIITLFDLEHNNIEKNYLGLFETIRMIKSNEEYLSVLDYFGNGVFIWNIETGERHLPQIFNEHLTTIVSIDMTKKFIANGYAHRYVTIYDLKTGEEFFSESLHKSRVFSLSFSSNEEWLGSAGQDGSISLVQIIPS